MMQVKDRVQLNIESVAFGGDGVGRMDGLVVFVPFTVAGDVANVQIIQRKKSFARGHLLEILAPSPFRTDPRCPYFGRCGGCAYQHILYEHQLEMKRRQVEDAFVKIAKMDQPNIKDVIASPMLYGYRGKATLHSAQTARRFQMGFMDVSGGALVDIERCEIMHESINDQIRLLRTGPAISAGQEDITLWSEHEGGSENDVLRRVKDSEFVVPPEGFFQANLYLTDRMVDEVCRVLKPRQVGTLVDACCGCGLFSVFLAPYASRLYGVEIFEKSVHYARRNAAAMGIKNAEFICGDIGDVLADMSQRKENIDVLVLDPPRTGLEPETLAAVSGIKPAEIIYISCNPATQARDCRILSETGYELQCLQPLDMFPQTQHIETIGWLRKRPAGVI